MHSAYPNRPPDRPVRRRGDLAWQIETFGRPEPRGGSERPAEKFGMSESRGRLARQAERFGMSERLYALARDFGLFLVALAVTVIIGSVFMAVR